jgi:hypothetical protein
MDALDRASLLLDASAPAKPADDGNDWLFDDNADLSRAARYPELESKLAPACTLAPAVIAEIRHRQRLQEKAERASAAAADARAARLDAGWKHLRRASSRWAPEGARRRGRRPSASLAATGSRVAGAGEPPTGEQDAERGTRSGGARTPFAFRCLDRRAQQRRQARRETIARSTLPTRQRAAWHSRALAYHPLRRTGRDDAAGRRSPRPPSGRESGKPGRGPRPIRGAAVLSVADGAVLFRQPVTKTFVDPAEAYASEQTFSGRPRTFGRRRDERGPSPRAGPAAAEARPAGAPGKESEALLPRDGAAGGGPTRGPAPAAGPAEAAAAEIARLAAAAGAPERERERLLRQARAVDARRGGGGPRRGTAAADEAAARARQAARRARERDDYRRSMGLRARRPAGPPRGGAARGRRKGGRGRDEGASMDGGAAPARGGPETDWRFASRAGRLMYQMAEVYDRGDCPSLGRGFRRALKQRWGPSQEDE